MGESIKKVVLHSGLSNQGLTALNREAYERYCMEVWHSDETEMKEEKKVNKFLEIKEGQEIDKIEKEYKNNKEEIYKNDKIQQMILELEQKIKDTLKEEHRESKYVHIVCNEYERTTLDSLDELVAKTNGKKEEVRMKYAKIAALVEDMSATDKIKIYERYGILD